MNVYVAAPFVDRAVVRELHARLEDLGIEWTSRWAETPGDDPENLSDMSHDVLLRLAARNDYDVARAHVVLVLARPGAGGEMFAEARLAQDLNKVVVWCGRQTLSAYRGRTVRVADVEEALGVLRTLMELRAVRELAAEGR